MNVWRELEASSLNAPLPRESGVRGSRLWELGGCSEEENNTVDELIARAREDTCAGRVGKDVVGESVCDIEGESMVGESIGNV